MVHKIVLKKKWCIALLSIVILTSCGSVNSSSNMDEIWEKAEKEVAEQKAVERETQLKEATAKFNSDENITLEAKDIQFDMSNHVDQSFLIVGKAELYTYFNYGFRDIEGTHFSVNVTPQDGSIMDSWIIYFDRNAFKQLFDDLKIGERTVIIRASIPSNIYEQGQGNLALGEKIQW